MHQHNAFLENFYDFAVQGHYKSHHKSRARFGLWLAVVNKAPQIWLIAFDFSLKIFTICEICSANHLKAQKMWVTKEVSCNFMFTSSFSNLVL